MAISKIILNGVTQMDLTSDTVAASNLIAPNTAHGADGEAVVGTATSSSITMTDEVNTTGITLVITTSGGSTPTPVETWETLFDGSTYTAAADGGFDLHNQAPTLPAPLFGADETWRITIEIENNNNTYICETNSDGGTYYIGNINIQRDTYDGTGLPFVILAYGWGTPGKVRPKPQENGFIYVKLEKLVTS